MLDDLTVICEPKDVDARPDMIAGPFLAAIRTT